MCGGHNGHNRVQILLKPTGQKILVASNGVKEVEMKEGVTQRSILWVSSTYNLLVGSICEMKPRVGLRMALRSGS